MSDRWVLYPATSRLPAAASPDLRGRSFVLRAELAAPVGSAEGVLIASGDAQAGFSFFVDNRCLVFVYHHAGATSTTTSAIIDSAAAVLAVAITDGGEGGTVELRADAGVVGIGSIGRLALARLSYTGVDVGQDRGYPVGDYDGPFSFNGSLRRVVVTADPIVRADNAGALAIEFATG